MCNFGIPYHLSIAYMKRVLLVEDSDMIRENLIEILELAQYTVLIASNGAEAIDIALEHTPDLIISDILMPELDGYNMLTVLRGIKTLKDIPVIFCTALSEQTALKKAMAFGACDYIIKPFDPDELLEKIAKYLNDTLPLNSPH